MGRKNRSAQIDGIVIIDAKPAVARASQDGCVIVAQWLLRIVGAQGVNGPIMAAWCAQQARETARDDVRLAEIERTAARCLAMIAARLGHLATLSCALCGVPAGSQRQEGFAGCLRAQMLPGMTNQRIEGLENVIHKFNFG